MLTSFAMSKWFLESYVSSGNILRRVPLSKLPFTVGRGPECSMSINSPHVSRVHAEFINSDDRLVLRDLGSTNGIFCNHGKVSGSCVVNHGDVLHFADAEYRLILEEVAAQESEKTQFAMADLPRRLPQGLRELQELLDGAQTTSVLQPIVQASDQQVFGYEILGRGRHPQLPQAPGELFNIAESANKEVELSELFMRRGVECACQYSEKYPFFINTHPRELNKIPRLIRNLCKIRVERPTLPVVLEIHEEAVTDLATIRKLRHTLHQQNIKLAYDDFGAGQARLLELVEAPPDFLKFDIAFMQDIDTAAPMRMSILEALLKISREAGITTLAEGVDSAQKVEICRDLGFDLLQGYHFPCIEDLD